ncbi:hypothetical protein L7F22_048432 [Adiantum nelumboides]|nr:hypothetical protein [Adiantum nelumboides]
MMDESTDIATCQHMIVYASFIEDSDLVTVFLGLLEVAEGTFEHLHESASNAYAQYIDQIVNEIASTFSKSSIRSAKLADLEAEFGCAMLQMSRIHKVRWLSRSMCVHKVCESLEALLVFLKEKKSSLFDKVKDFQFVYSLHFMADILQRLAMLSKIFQNAFVDITAVVGLIEAEMRLITSQFIEVPIVDVNAFVLDGLDYPMIPDYGPRNGQLAALRASIRGNMYRSVELERAKCGKDMDAAISFQKQFSQFIVANLRQRFPDMGLLSSFKALSPCCFPTGIAYRNFGYDMIDNLLSFYGEPKVLHGETIDPLVSKVNAKREYDVFREQAHYEWKGRGLKYVWLSIGRNPTTREKYPTLLKLAELAMLQCASTASCERGFSVQNLIKTCVAI